MRLLCLVFLLFTYFEQKKRENTFQSRMGVRTCDLNVRQYYVMRVYGSSARLFSRPALHRRDCVELHDRLIQRRGALHRWGWGDLVIYRSNTSQDLLQSLCTSTLSEISHLSTPLISLTKPTRAGQLNSLALDPYTRMTYYRLCPVVL